MSPSRSPPRRPFALKPVAAAARILARPVYKKHGLAEGAIGENWAEIVGEDWARVSSPRHLSRASRTLTVRVAGARALELAHLEREIAGRINAFAGRELVLRLKLIQGPIGARAHSGGGSRGLGRGAAPPSLPPSRREGETEDRLASALAALGAALAERHQNEVKDARS